MDIYINLLVDETRIKKCYSLSILHNGRFTEMSKQNIKVVKGKETKKDLTLKILPIVISVIALFYSIYIGNKTSNITEKQNKFTRKMQLSIQSEKDSLQKVHNTVSQAETVSNDILLGETYQPSNKEKLENLSNKASEIQNNYYNDLNQKNKYAGQLDKSLTLLLTNTRNNINVIINTKPANQSNTTTAESKNLTDKTTKHPILAITGGEDPKLEQTFDNYKKEEQKLINKNAK